VRLLFGSSGRLGYDEPMAPLRIMLDNNIFDELASDPDTRAMVNELQAVGTIKLMITDAIEEQLAEAHVRKTAQTINLTVISSSGVVWDVSKHDQADWADDATEKRLNRVQGNKSKGKQTKKHWIDTLMSVTATNKADVFVSKDKRLKRAVKRTVAEEGLKLQVWDYEEFCRHMVGLSASEKGKRDTSDD
jgi:hypothetical protein